MNSKLATTLVLIGASVAVFTKWREADADRTAWRDATDQVE